MHHFVSVLFAAAFLVGASQSKPQLEPIAASYKWRAELGGPVKRCRVPESILFVVGDAIIEGKIIFRHKAYYPRGRLEDNLETGFSLVRRNGDQKPLVTIRAKADGSWNGTWTAAGKGCVGPVKIAPR